MVNGCNAKPGCLDSSFSETMRRWLLTGVTWTTATLLLLPVCAFTAIMVAGPHSDLLPALLQPPAFIVCVLVLLGLPAYLARKVWRR